VAHDTLTVKSADGTATQIIDVKITGANDVPVISHAAGSDIAGNVTEDAAATLSASGTLSIADADAGQSSFVAQAATAAAHGTFTLTTAGAWTYAADNTQAAIQQLGAGQTLTDSFTAVSLDSAASQVITVTIHGTNDPATISGKASGAVTEDGGVANAIAGTPVASGTLSVTDADAGQAVFQAVLPANLVGTYGDFTFNETSGAWNYTLDPTRSDVLAAAQVAHDTLTVQSADGSAAQVIDVTVTGANDAPVATGTYKHSVIDTVAPDVFADLTGVLTAIDPDAGDTLTWTGGGAGAFGALTVNANGSYSYAVDSVKVNALQLGFNATDSFTVTVTDTAGLADTRTIDVNVVGENDAPVIDVPATVNGLSISFTATDVDDLTLSMRVGGGKAAPLGDLGAVNNGSLTTLTAVAQPTAIDGALKVSDTVNATPVGVCIALGTNSADNFTRPSAAQPTALWGFGGDDILSGGSDNDTLMGGTGNDTFTVDAGIDTIADLGDGSDVLVVSTVAATANAMVVAAFTATAATSNAGTANLTTAGFAVNLASATGANGFTVTNTGAATTLTGSAKADTLIGGTGNDTLVGGAGNDTLTGGL